MSCIEEAFQVLNDQELIGYGKFISRKMIEKALETKYTYDPKDWSFRGPYLALKAFIEQKGYFCSSRGHEDGSIRILNANEMAVKCEHVLENVCKRQKRTMETMQNAEIDDLIEREQSLHAHAMKKLSMGYQASRSVLYDI